MGTRGYDWLDEIDKQLDFEREEGRKEGWLKGWREGWRDGWREGQEAAGRNFVTRLLKRGNDSLDEIANLSKLDIEEVKAIQEEIAKNA
jgi:predicted transposase YdaD